MMNLEKGPESTTRWWVTLGCLVVGLANGPPCRKSNLKRGVVGQPALVIWVEYANLPRFCVG